MRELDKRLVAAVQRLLPGALLLVGARSQVLNAITCLEQPSAPAPEAHDAALWLAPPDALAIRTGLAALRAKLKPGAPVVLALRKRPPLLQRARGALFGAKPVQVELELACGALLASGLALPRVHAGTRVYYLLSASLPHDPCALDAFFAQPAAS